MSYRRHQGELGALVDVHRPARPWVGWLVSGLFALPFALLFAVGPGPIAGIVAFVVIGLSIAYGLGEWFFLEQRLYEHGIVLRSIPGLRVFVIPHYVVDPTSFEVGGRRVHEGTLEEAIKTGLERRFRVTPLTSATVRFVGLHPKRAHQLAKGRLSWSDVGSGVTLNGKPDPAPVMNWWWISYRDPQRHNQLLADTVRRSQQTRPYDGAGSTPPTSG